eukprot:475765_1
MKYTLAAATFLAAQVGNTAAFAPTSFSKAQIVTQRAAVVDPSILSDVHQHAEAISSIFSSISLADAADAVADAVPAATDVAATAAVTDAVPAAADVAATADAAVAAGNDNGWFGFLEGPIEQLLQIIHSSLVSVGMSEDAWGVSIIAMTSLIKLATYPLTKQQLESTNKMQALQPTIKETQAKYASNPEVMNQKISEIYQTNEVNPLAGCIPSLLQIPIFIGLYRAVLTLAKDDKLNEPFLFLPNLEGPTYGADPAHGSDWLFQGWVNGAPGLGWEDTIAFLSIPIILVLSQSLSMQLMATKDQEQPAVLKFLPLLIGWLSLNVPAALGIYWVANNFITTALTLQIRGSFDPVTPVTATSGGAKVVDTTPTAFTPAPIREKPAGFSSGTADSDGIKPITAIDADIVDTSVAVEETQASSSQPKRSKGKKRGKKRKKK